MEIMTEITNLLKDPRNINLSDMTKRLLIKDHLITYILDYIYHHPRYRKLVFYGGTCAEIVYGLPRLSEDIDLENSAKIAIDEFGNDLETYLRKKFKLENLDVYVQKGEGGSHRATVRIPRVLYSAKLAPTENEKLHVKVEMSNHVQVFQIETTPIVRGGKVMTIVHFDKSSLMAGKMIACMERVFKKGVTSAMVKGRDWYDLWWYLSQRVVPNEEKLRADSEGKVGADEAWKIIGKQLKTLKRRDLEVDLIPFFADQVFINDWLDNFKVYYKNLLKN